MIKKIKKTIGVVLTSMFLLMSFFVLQPAFAQSTSSSVNRLNSAHFKFNLQEITNDDINTQGWVRKGVNYLFERAISIMAGLIGSAAVLMMVVGGFMMMISAGRQDMYDKGKGYLINALIGLSAVLGAYVIVTTVQLLIRSIFS